MARARQFKPGFFRNEDLAECEFSTRLCFAGLWQLADREGRLEDRPKRIKGELFAFDSVEVDPMLQELAARGFIVRYRVGDLALIQVVNFAKHQNPHHREAASTLPALPGWTPPKREKPEADDQSQGPEASGQPEASPRLSGQEVDLARGSSRADSLTPSSLTPDTGQLLPADDVGVARPRAARAKSAAKEGKTVATWQAYSAAFENRHGAPPLRNAKVNGQLAKFVDAVGQDEAPKIAEFYVRSDEPYYVRCLHSVDLMLRDAPKLHALWRSGRAAPPQPVSARDGRMQEAIGLIRNRHRGFDQIDYTEGIDAEGRLA